MPTARPQAGAGRGRGSIRKQAAALDAAWVEQATGTQPPLTEEHQAVGTDEVEAAAASLGGEQEGKLGLGRVVEVLDLRHARCKNSSAVALVASS